jgi:hypothetical protein
MVPVTETRLGGTSVKEALPVYDAPMLEIVPEKVLLWVFKFENNPPDCGGGGGCCGSAAAARACICIRGAGVGKLEDDVDFGGLPALQLNDGGMGPIVQ